MARKDISKSAFLRVIEAAVATDASIAQSRTQLGIQIGKTLARSSVRMPALSMARRFAKLQARDARQASEDLRQLLLYLSYLGLEPAELADGEDAERDDRQSDRIEARVAAE